MQGLRLHDNDALHAASERADALYTVFCLDPWFISSGRVGTARIKFLLQSLQNLDVNLRKRHGRLIVLHGDPKTVLPAVAEVLKVSHVYFEKDTEPYALERDTAVSESLGKMGIEVCFPGVRATNPVTQTCLISCIDTQFMYSAPSACRAAPSGT